MIDHVLGRPSVKSRRLQVLAVILVWSAVLARGHRHGPPGARSVSRFLSRKLSTWQTLLVSLICAYAARNASTLLGFSAPEPLAGMYDPAYFRATWVMTALDAGFWTAMRIRSRWLRDLAGVVFSVFYLFAAERADEKVRKVRSSLTVEHMRVSWNKRTTPYLNLAANLLRPRMMRWPPREIRIPRPPSSDYKDPVSAWLYYDGPVSELREHSRLILDVPGGGWVAMGPRCHDDRLLAWATRTGLPILSLDYRKAPEHPYPYALNECFDVYTTIVNSRGKCLGLAGNEVPSIVVSGDSAGGNLAVATTLMLIERNLDPARLDFEMPLPDGVMLCYPSLDMNIGNWMTDEQMSLIRDRRMRRTNRPIVRRKSMQYASLVGTPHHSDDEDGSPARDSAPGPLGDENGKPGAPMFVPTSTHARSTAAPVDVPPQFLLSPQPEYSHGGPMVLSPTDVRLDQGRFRENATGGAKKGPTPLDKGSRETPQTTQTQSKAPQAALSVVPQNPPRASTSHHPEPLRTRLATSSMISYFNDRVLTPEMMRAMIILYIGPHNRPDFSRDYLLSPLLAPDFLLERFPKTYFLTGERDPLVDDTVIFAGRLRRVKEALFDRNNNAQQQQQQRSQHIQFPQHPSSNSLEYTPTICIPHAPDPETEPVFDAKDAAEVTLIPGASHGFLQVPGLYPPAWKLFDRCARWMEDMFMHADWVRQQPTLCQACSSPTSRRSSGSSTPAVQISPAGADLGHRRIDSEGSDGGYLEMSAGRTRGVKVGTRADSFTAHKANDDGTNNTTTHGDGLGVDIHGFAVAPHSAHADRGRTTGRRRSGARKDRSLVKLRSTDDLLGRRMEGLAAGLTRSEEEDA